MLKLLQFTIFILLSPIKDTYSQTTQSYDEQYHHIQKEFTELFDDSKKCFVSQGAEFVSSLMRNRTYGSQTPMTLSDYCLLQTLWALASGNVELAETYTNRTECFNSDSEPWFENFKFDPMWVFDMVKLIFNIKEGNDIFKRIAVSLNRNYDVLIKAAESADDSLIVWLENSGLDLSPNGIEAVGSAWERDHLDTVILLLEMGAFGDNSAENVVNLNNSKGETLLHFAAERGLKEMARKLINDGANVNQLDVNSLTPLHHAMRANDRELAELLMDNGAERRTWVLGVHHNGRLSINDTIRLQIEVNNFLEDSASYKTGSKNSLLHAAAYRGSLVAVKNLIKNLASVNSKNAEGLTPLYISASIGNPDFFFFLLNNGAACRDSFESLLHIAAGRGDTTVMESLVNHCVPVDEFNVKGVTPLYSAASAGERAAMEFLLAVGADLYITLRNGGKLLHVAAAAGDVVALQSLLDVGMHVDTKDTDRLTGLCRAVQTDNIVSLELLVEKGADTSFRTPVGDTLLHLAAVSGSHKSIRHLVKLGLYIDSENDQNETPLYLAAKNNNTEVAKLLISLGANRNHVTSKGGTLAHLATERNDFAALLTLFKIGADFNLIDREGYTPLYNAISKSKLKTATFMLEIGVNLFHINRDNNSLLHIAGRNKDHKAIDFLIDRGIYVDFKVSNGSRPIDAALFAGHCETAEHFIKKGANVRGRSGMNRTILHSAVIGGCNNFLTNIAEKIDNIDPKDENMQTPLHLAAALGRADISDTLMLLGADANSLDKFNSSPFQIAAINGNWNMVSSFLKKDVKLDWTDSHKRTLLHLATLENKEDIVKYLTENLRVNVNVKDIDGRIPLHSAAEKGWLRIMRYLVDERIPESIDQQDDEGKTPLHLATIGGHDSVVEYLLAKGADPQVKDRIGQTPLIYAAKLHIWETAHRLLGKRCLASGTNDRDEHGRTVLHLAILDKQINIISNYEQCLNNAINSKDFKGRIPLHIAAQEGLSQVMRYLIDESVTKNIDYRDEEEKTPLHLAAIGGSESTVEYILEKGADPQAEDSIGQTPLIYAAKHHNWNIVRIILNKTCMVSRMNYTDQQGRTVLHLAVLDEQIDIISSNRKCLKQLINTKDSKDETPLDLAIAIRNWDIVKNFFIQYRPALKVKDCIALMLAEVGCWEIVRSLSAAEVGPQCRDEKNRTLLHLAAMQGDEDTVLSLIENRVIDLDATDANNRTALHLAAIYGKIEIINYLLNKNKIAIFDTTLQLIAAQRNMSSQDRQDIMDYLILRGVDYSMVDEQKRNILHLIAISGDIETLEYILDSYKLDINGQDVNSRTPLHTAIINGHYNMVDTLLAYEADMNLLDIDNYTPLVYAIKDRFDAVSLLDEHADINWSDRNNRSILHLAAMYGCPGVVRKLLNSAGSDVKKMIIDRLDVNGQTPLHLAVLEHGGEIVELLLHEGANGYSLDKENNTPLDLAVLSGNWQAAEFLIETGYYEEHNYARNRTLLHIAILNGLRNIINNIINNEITDLLAADIFGDTPLHYAARKNDGITVEKLLNKRVDKNILNNNGQNPLTEAMVSGSWEAVGAFLNGNCDVEGVDRNNRTLLHYAALDGNKKIIDHLLSCTNVNINAMDNNNETALDLILRNHSLRFLDDYDDINWRDGRGRSILHLCNRHPYLIPPYDALYHTFRMFDSEDNEGQTPLHIASSKGDVFEVMGLVQRGASLFKADINGHSPLHLAAMHGHESVVDWAWHHHYFLRANARDSLGRTPLQLALDNGHQETASLLKLYQAVI